MLHLDIYNLQQDITHLCILISKNTIYVQHCLYIFIQRQTRRQVEKDCVEQALLHKLTVSVGGETRRRLFRSNSLSIHRVVKRAGLYSISNPLGTAWQNWRPQLDYQFRDDLHDALLSRDGLYFAMARARTADDTIDNYEIRSRDDSSPLSLSRGKGKLAPDDVARIVSTSLKTIGIFDNSFCLKDLLDRWIVARFLCIVRVRRNW